MSHGGSYLRRCGGVRKVRINGVGSVAAGSQVLVLDEPVTGLDPRITEEMYAMLERCIHELGLTILMVSHDLPRVFHEVHQVLYLAKGKQMFFGETEDFLKEHPEVWKQGGIL